MTHRLKQDEGFTLVELLVVILIIGILAAIALPVFTNQQRRGQDASAKSDARNASTQMETCFSDLQTYAGCPALAGGLSVGAGVGQVQLVSSNLTDYVVQAQSRSGCNFRLNRTAAGVTRTTTGANCPVATW